jgi:hypothetical protein
MRLMSCITGHWVAAAVYAAARLGIADQLRDGPRSSDDVAKAVGGHPSSVYRLLRALATLGIFDEVRPRTFALTEVGDLLRADHPQSMRSMALFQGAPPHWQGWGSFLHSVRTGESAFEHVHGKGFFDYCQTDREFGAAFDGAMTGMSAATVSAVLEAYDFSGIARLVDVGGGHGYLLSRILVEYPALKGCVYDLPHVVAGAAPLLKAAGVAGRCETAGGSFFDAVPPSDAYISKHIIHDWDDESCLKILRNMRQGLAPGGRVLLVEVVIGAENNREALGTLIDLEMLHSTHGGRERTESEFAALFSTAGLKLTRVVPTQSLFSVLEARAA